MNDLQDDAQRAYVGLSSALLRTQPDGTPLYTEEVVDDVLALLVLSCAPLDALQAHEEDLLRRFCARARIDGSVQGTKLQAQIDAYVKRVIPASLMAEVSALVRDLSIAGGPSEAVHAVLGQTSNASDRVPVSQRAPADGATRLGALGRFAFKPKS